MYYDAPGRLIRTELPDGTFSRVEFSPWLSRGYDPNDTAETGKRWYAEHTAHGCRDGRVARRAPRGSPRGHARRDTHRQPRTPVVSDRAQPVPADQCPTNCDVGRRLAV